MRRDGTRPIKESRQVRRDSPVCTVAALVRKGPFGKDSAL